MSFRFCFLRHADYFQKIQLRHTDVYTAAFISRFAAAAFRRRFIFRQPSAAPLMP